MPLPQDGVSIPALTRSSLIDARVKLAVRCDGSDGESVMRTQLIFASMLTCVLSASGSAIAADNVSFKTAGGLTIYLGVLPAAMIQGHAKDHPEAAMHGGVPGGPHAYHVMAAVFNAESGERIENATVEARVTPLGLAAVTRPLMPMVIAGTVTYGNYFTMRGEGPYRITFSVTTPQVAEPVVLEFTYEHRTR